MLCSEAVTALNQQLGVQILTLMIHLQHQKLTPRISIVRIDILVQNFGQSYYRCYWGEEGKGDQSEIEPNEAPQ